MKKSSTLTISDAVAVATGSEHSLIVDEWKYVWTCGDNAHGQLGDNTFVDKSYLTRVVKSTTSIDYLTNIVQVAGADRFSVCIGRPHNLRAGLGLGLAG